jgi:hypothetical protein
MSNNNNVQNVVGTSNAPFTDQRVLQNGGGGGQGNGNMVYSGQTINFNDGGGNIIIDTINQGDQDFELGNNAGNLEFQADTGEVGLNSNEDLSLNAESDIVIIATQDALIDSNSTLVVTRENQVGEQYFTIQNRDGNDNVVNNIALTRGADGSTTFAGTNYDRYQFATSTGAVDILPSYRFSDTSNTGAGGDFVQFTNSPQNANDVLIWNGLGSGAGDNPKQLAWGPVGSSGVASITAQGIVVTPAGGTGAVNLDADVKSLIGGTNVTVVDNNGEWTINAGGGGGGNVNYNEASDPTEPFCLTRDVGGNQTVIDKIDFNSKRCRWCRRGSLLIEPA